MERVYNETRHVTHLDRRRLELLAASIEGKAHMQDYVAMLRESIETADAVPSGRIPDDVVTMNSVVRYEDRTLRKVSEVTLVYPEDADPAKGLVSVLSPLGNALLGLRVGQAGRLRLPAGEERRIKVLAVLYQPEAAGSLTV